MSASSSQEDAEATKISPSKAAAPRGRRVAAMASAAVGLIAVVAAGLYLAGGEADTEDAGRTVALRETPDEVQSQELIRQSGEAERQRRAEEAARRLAEAEARRDAEDTARREAEEAAQRLAAEAQREAEAEAERRALEQARLLAEAEARRDAEETARREAEEAAQRLAAEAQREAEAEAERRAMEEAQREAETEAERQAMQEARLAAEAEARRQAEEAARRQAEAERKAAQAPQLVTRSQALFTLKNVNVRAAPTVESEKLATVRAGSLLQVTGSLADGSWHRVELSNDMTGFVWAPLLSNRPPRNADRPEKRTAPQQANLTPSTTTPVKSPQEFERYLAEHRREIRRKLTDYNRRYRVIVAPSAYTDDVEVSRIHKVEALMFSGDRVQVRFTLQVGRVRRTSGARVFEMQWVGDDLQVVGHQK